MYDSVTELYEIEHVYLYIIILNIPKYKLTVARSTHPTFTQTTQLLQLKLFQFQIHYSKIYEFFGKQISLSMPQALTPYNQVNYKNGILFG